MRVVIVCPDKHLVYDGRTPGDSGVGGGVTVRVRVAAALAKRGIAVTLVCNCRRASEYQGVRYLPLEDVPHLDADVVLLHSSGGAVDVAPAISLPISTKLLLVLVSGISRVAGIEAAAPDAVYLPSNFLRRYVTETWGLPASKMFVTYHGVSRPGMGNPSSRNPFRLLYPSHPAKGLDAALGVWRRLRAEDERFELEICGGDRLWGGTQDNRPPLEDGLTYSGLLGQRALFERLQGAGFVVQLQEVQEGFGISVAEGMAAGCIVLASPVGAYAETVRHGFNGFLVAGPHLAAETQERAVRLILDLMARPEVAERVRRNAALSPMEWDEVAATWIGHWEWLLGGKTACPDWARCVQCAVPALPLADGYHCIRCGEYSQRILVAK